MAFVVQGPASRGCAPFAPGEVGCLSGVSLCPTYYSYRYFWLLADQSGADLSNKNGFSNSNARTKCGVYRKKIGQK
jgi:hypothetical protein